MAGWTAVETVGVVAAGAQVVAAAFTGLMAYRTHDLAIATTEEARATQALLKHSQRELELSWSPFLVVKMLKRRALDGTPEWVEITNLGRGPALNGFYAFRVEGVAWCWMTFDGIKGDGGTRSLKTTPGDGDPPWGLLEPSPRDPDQTSRLTEVIFCEDVFRNRIRYAVGRTGRKVFRPIDPEPPAWAGSVGYGNWTWSPPPDGRSGHAPTVDEA